MTHYRKPKVSKKRGPLPQETRDKISESLTGYEQDQQHIDRKINSRSRKNVIWTPEARRKKIKIAMENYWRDRKETTQAERDKSQAHSKKISEAMKSYWA